MCHQREESSSHCPRDCPTVHQIWGHLISPNQVNRQMQSDLVDWIISNIKRKKSRRKGTSWATNFVSCLREICKAQNNKVFNDASPNQNFIATQIVKKARLYHEPLEGNLGPAEYGVAARDNTGKWIWSVYGNIGSCNSLNAELWAIREGLLTAVDKRINKIMVESDCSAAIDLIKTTLTVNPQHNTLIEDSPNLAKGFEPCTFMHTLRETNRCTDALANLEILTNLERVVTDVPFAPSDLAFGFGCLWHCS
ncbi:hypothetical protein F0562_013843 [Nyssa sinensis]|uniref:RNase H type-1 domain-containing protein n=1 Tax=Nyssa sinensis TaxID=561372 RepID=A0A5J4ZL19_9ASTE|nr:hypothetical protein F0562_013843 [Nyssa sinensis]